MRTCLSIIHGSKIRRIVIAVLLAGGFSMAEPSAVTENPESFFSGYSNQLFTDITPADAVASLSVWTDFLMEHWSIRLESKPIVFSNTESMKASLLANEVDMVTMLTEEFFGMEDEVNLSHIYFSSSRGKIADEYVLLVRCDSGLENLAALQGKTIVLMGGGPRHLGKVWLETQLMKQGFSGLPAFFQSSTVHSKTAQVVLNVFFGTSDTCLINRRGYEIMVELNPQVGKALRVIETSPALVTALTCLRESYKGTHKQELIAALQELHTEPRGKQILTVFKSDKLVPGTIEDLATTRELVKTHARLKSQSNQAATQKVGALK